MVSIVAADKEGLKASRLRNHHLRGSSPIDYEADIILILNEKYDIVAKVNIEINPYQAQRLRDWVICSVEKDRGGQNAIDLEFRSTSSSRASTPAAARCRRSSSRSACITTSGRRSVVAPRRGPEGGHRRRTTTSGRAPSSRRGAARSAGIGRDRASSADRLGRMPRIPTPDVVFLDVGDTLVRPEPSWLDVYATVFPAFGIQVERDDFERAWRDAFVDWDFEGPFEATEEASYQRLKELDGRILARLGYPDLPDAFFRAVERAFHQRAAWWVYPDVLPALDALRAAGTRLAVISNWGWAAPELLHELELASHFEAMTVSARVGYQKPHPGIFRHALDLMAVAPSRSVHVGDSIRADVRGARAVGIAPVLIDRSLAGDPERRARLAAEAEAPVVQDLLELLPLLDIPEPASTAPVS
jgi:REG-2-like HAD superfamily hydrolase